MIYKKKSVAGYMWRQHGWAFALLALAGLGLGAIKISAYQTASQFAAHGVEVVGEVTHMTDYSTKSRPSFSVSYTFATASAPYNNGNQAVSKSFYQALTDGGPISVWYLPSDPASSVVDRGKLSAGFGPALALAAALILAGVIGGSFSISRARACVGMRETGDALAATVIEHVSEGKKKLKGHFQWRDSSGAVGRSQAAALADLPPIGSPVTIFTDPARRLKPVWEGDIGSR